MKSKNVTENKGIFPYVFLFSALPFDLQKATQDVGGTELAGSYAFVFFSGHKRLKLVVNRASLDLNSCKSKGAAGGRECGEDMHLQTHAVYALQNHHRASK